MKIKIPIQIKINRHLDLCIIKFVLIKLFFKLNINCSFIIYYNRLWCTFFALCSWYLITFCIFHRQTKQFVFSDWRQIICALKWSNQNPNISIDLKQLKTTISQWELFCLEDSTFMFTSTIVNVYTATAYECFCI